jgi:hypothetical protein
MAEKKGKLWIILIILEIVTLASSCHSGTSSSPEKTDGILLCKAMLQHQDDYQKFFQADQAALKYISDALIFSQPDVERRRAIRINFVRYSEQFGESHSLLRRMDSDLLSLKLHTAKSQLARDAVVGKLREHDQLLEHILPPLNQTISTIASLMEPGNISEFDALRNLSHREWIQLSGSAYPKAIAEIVNSLREQLNIADKDLRK